MAQAGFTAWMDAPRDALALTAARLTELMARHLRLTVLVSMILICGSFGAAVVLQMKLVQDQAIETMQIREQERLRDLSQSVVQRLDFFAALGRHFDTTGAAHFSPMQVDIRIATQRHMAALRNIILLQRDGEIETALAQNIPNSTQRPWMAKELRDKAMAAPQLIATDQALWMLLPRPEGLIAIHLDKPTMFSLSVLKRVAIFTPEGRMLGHGDEWAGPFVKPQAQIQALIEEERVLVSSTLGHWPAVIVSSLSLTQTLQNRQTYSPIYLFLLIAPALAGAGIAMVFVHEAEHRRSSHARLQNLRRQPTDQRLLIRLADAERRAAEAERSKQEFVAHMSHELRTPLNAIIGFSEAISHEFFGPPGHAKYIEYAKDIAASGRDLHGKIGDILEFANLEAGRYPLKLARANLGEIAAQCVNDMQGRAFSRHISLTIGGQSTGDVLSDICASKRILGNLLANALDFTPDGGRVDVEIGRHGKHAFVRIRDTGAGFDTAEVQQACESFVSIKRGTGRTGIGLGLPIAAQLAMRMNGMLRLSANQGLGTTAELRLPRGDL